MSGGRFDGNIDYWSPEPVKGILGKGLTPYGSNNIIYQAGKFQILRIIPAADMTIRFLKKETGVDPDDNALDTAAGDIVLKAGLEYFISSGESEWMLASVNTANVVPVLQRGSVARSAKIKS